MDKLRVLQVGLSCPINDRIINTYNAKHEDSSIMPGSYEHEEIVYSVLEGLHEDKVDIYFCTPGSLEQALNEISPHIVNISMGDIRNGINYMSNNKHKTLFVVSAGNEGLQGESALAMMECTTSVGALTENDQIKSYSSRGKGHVRFAFRIPKSFTYRLKGELKTKYGIEGTSFASPLQATEFAKMHIAYYDLFNTWPSTYTALQIAKFNARDVLTYGFDLESGYGEFKQSDKTMLKVPYDQTDAETIQLTIDSKLIKVGTRVIEMDVAPFVMNQRTFVPVRFVSEALGKNVEWDGANRKVIIK